MPAEFQFDVFLSHNSADKPRVRKLAERLKGARLRVWFDEWSIQPGDDIYLAIERGLEASRTLVLCLSPAALGSDWVGLERSTVLFRDPANAGRRFIPLLLADCKLPDTLRRYKYVDYRKETQAAFDQLLAGCRPQEQGKPQGEGTFDDASPLCVVWVLGSYSDLSPGELAFTKKLLPLFGAGLAQMRVKLVTGKSDMLAELAKHYLAVSLSARLPGPPPVEIRGRLRQRDLKELFIQAIGEIPVVGIVVGGGVARGCVEEECRAAEDAGIPIVPVPSTGGAAAKAPLTDHVETALYARLARPAAVADAGDAATALLKVVELFIQTTNPIPPKTSKRVEQRKEKSMRDDFSEKAKETLARRVGMRCSNPGCRKPTSGPRDDPEKALNIGVAAHITAASPGGPRYDASLSVSVRCSFKNAIWLCQNCAKLVDSDERRFTVEVLRRWKKAAEDAARHRIETNEDEQRLPQAAEREPVRPYATVARPNGECSILFREHLYREDFEDGSVICPVAWDHVAQTLRQEPIVAVQAPPGSGKSTLAAWMDWKLSPRTQVEYLSGRRFQNSDDTALVAALHGLPDESVVLLDDAHLVQRHLDQLMRASIAQKMRFLLISRPGGFANIPGIPQPIDLSAAAKSIALELASKYASTPEEASSVLLESQGDLVFTKWLLGALQQNPLQRNPTLDVTVITKLKQFWDIDKELLRLLLVLSAYRWLELSCSIDALTGTFGFGSKTIEALTERLREATLDRSANSISLDRHPKLAGLFQKTASKFQYYAGDVLKPTCTAFRIDHSMVADARFGHVVLGLAVGSGAVRASDVVDRLLFSTLHADCVEFSKTAACIESKLNPAVDGLDARTVERRLTIAFAAYDAMRRERDEDQAWKLLTELRARLEVTGNPAMAFERKGYLLYQVGFHYLLINQLGEALNYLKESAEVDDLWATQHNAKLHFGKSAMSRIAAARAAADVLLSSGNGPEEPKPDMQQVGDLAEKLDAERVRLEGLIGHANGMDWFWFQRWYLNALLHLAELRACLGNVALVETLTHTATAVGAAIGLETSTRRSAKLAHGTLAFHQRDFQGVVDLLEDIPAKQQKAGERSGRFAQLLAIAYRELGKLEEHNRWCRWLANECAADKANGPAVAWAKAVLRRGDAKL